MKVAIIGANGFIGSRLVEIFHLGGIHNVVAVVRQPSSLALPARFAVEWKLGNALDVASLAGALAGCDAVVHAAIGDPVQIERMPAILCEAAAKAGVRRVVYLSSASVHGQKMAPGTDETTPLRTDFSLEYNNAKVRAERSYFSALKKYRLEGYALRPGIVFGPRSRWIADLAADLRLGRAWLYRNGQGVCNSIYVDNLVHAIDRCLKADRGAGEAYLVGDAEAVTWADFYCAAADDIGIARTTIRAVEKLPGFHKTRKQQVDEWVARPWVQSLLPCFPYKLKRTVKNLVTAMNPPPATDAWSLPSLSAPRITEELALLQQNEWRFPCTKAEKVLGYQPPVTFAEGMRRSLAWLRFANPAS